ncbi:MAG: oxidoreductase, partial [Alistipes sp.]|nr:oxidoreductase [Alistipes sp.]
MIKQLSPDIRDYELLDTGAGEKLERFGRYVVRRPEPQAIWQKSLDERTWQSADASFLRDAKVEDRGEWRLKPEMPSRWIVRYEHKAMSLRMRLALTSFK